MAYARMTIDVQGIPEVKRMLTEAHEAGITEGLRRAVRIAAQTEPAPQTQLTFTGARNRICKVLAQAVTRRAA